MLRIRDMTLACRCGYNLHFPPQRPQDISRAEGAFHEGYAFNSRPQDISRAACSAYYIVVNLMLKVT